MFVGEDYLPDRVVSLFLGELFLRFDKFFVWIFELKRQFLKNLLFLHFNPVVKDDWRDRVRAKAHSSIYSHVSYLNIALHVLF